MRLYRAERHQVKAFDTSTTKTWCPWLLMNSKTTIATSMWINFGFGRTNCISMGGLFPAQGANLHSVWGAYRNRSRFHKLGHLEISEEGWPVWHGSVGKVTLRQFRDNILARDDLGNSELIPCTLPA